jgi:hypothetical protein
MAYQIRGVLSSGRRFTASAESFVGALDLAKKAVRDGDCQRVDIFDTAGSNTDPIMTDERIRAAVQAETKTE